MSTPLIELRDIRKSYGGIDTPKVEVVRGVDLAIHPLSLIHI